MKSSYSLLKFMMLLVGVALCAPSALAQFQTFENGFNGDVVTASIQNSAGDYIYVWEGNAATTAAQIYISVMNPSGDIVQTTELNPTGTSLGNQLERVRDIIQAANGDYILVGVTESFDIFTATVEEDMLVMRLDSSFNIIWAAIYGNGTHNQRALAVMEDPNPGVPIGSRELLVTGYTFATGSSAGLFWQDNCTVYLRLGANGALLTHAVYDSRFDDKGRKIVERPGTNTALIIGLTSSHGLNPGFPIISRDIFVLEIEKATGNVISHNVYTPTFGSVDEEWPGSAQITAAGNLIIGGRTSSFGSPDGFAMEITPGSYSVNYFKNVGNTGLDQMIPLETSPGQFMIAGFAGNISTGDPGDIVFLPGLTPAMTGPQTGVGYGSGTLERTLEMVITSTRVLSAGGSLGFGTLPNNNHFVEVDHSGIGCDSFHVPLIVADQAITHTQPPLTTAQFLFATLTQWIPIPITPDDSLKCSVVTCFAQSDPAYLNVGSVTYTTDQNWPHKVFVPDNATVTVDGAILDITNSDVVFGIDAQIQFINGAMLRSNNSVYRPCDKTETWLGLDFLTGSSGIVDESIFKNAEIALEITGGSEVKVANNAFLNCGVGVLVANGGTIGPGIHKNGITGNTFEIDDDSPFPATTQYFGIQLSLTDMRGMISQNDFVNQTGQFSLGAATGLSFTGIEANHSRMVASSNNFSNVRFPIFMTSTIGFSEIANNEIHYTRYNDETGLIGINLVNNFSPVLVEGNSLTFTDAPEDIGNTIGLNASNITALTVRKNHFEGFQRSILMRQGRRVSIMENEIDNGTVVGIAVTNIGVSLNIDDNTVEMDRTAQNTIGISFQLTAGAAYVNSTVFISRNCVYETSTAISLTNTGGTNLQVMRVNNNLMYTYTANGMNILNYVGLLWNPPFPFYARNSFIANNAFANDINFSALGGGGLIPLGNCTTSGAYNVATGIGDNVFLPGGPFWSQRCSHSNCGGIISLRTSLSGQQIVMNMLEAEFPLRYIDGVLELHGSVEKAIISQPVDQRQDYARDLLHALRINPDNTALDACYLRLKQCEALDGQQDVISLHYFQLTRQWDQAADAISRITPRDEDEAEWLDIQYVIVNMNQQGRMVKELTGGETILLKQIDDRRELWAAQARSIVQISRGDHPYLFRDFVIPAAELNGERQTIVPTESPLNAYPNPTSGPLNLNFFMEDYTNAGLRVFDVMGRVIQVIPLEEWQMEATLDLGQLPEGVYYVSLYNQMGIVKTTKIVKQ